MSAPGKYLVCRECGSPNIRRDAFASWNADHGQWEMSEVYQSTSCQDCESESDDLAAEVPNVDLLSTAQRDTIFDGAYFGRAAHSGEQEA